jgi:hypothetical protein
MKIYNTTIRTLDLLEVTELELLGIQEALVLLSRLTHPSVPLCPALSSNDVNELLAKIAAAKDGKDDRVEFGTEADEAAQLKAETEMLRSTGQLKQ